MLLHLRVALNALLRIAEVAFSWSRAPTSAARLVSMHAAVTERFTCAIHKLLPW